MDDVPLAERAQVTVALLEALVADRALLAELSDDHRQRLLAAAGASRAPTRSTAGAW
jgi:hypothetical protein